MRFCKGDTVEVSSTKAGETGVWRCAEIISGNGHTYYVKYGWFPMTSNPEVERVPRKSIRPCPPPLGSANQWVRGDIIDAFDDLSNSWRPVIVLEVMDDNYSLVKLVGSSTTEFRAHKLRLRVQRCWKDGEWIVVNKDLESCGMSKGKSQPDTKVKPSVGDDCFPVEKIIEVPKPLVVSTKMLKRRSPLGECDFEVHGSAAKKKRMIGQDGGHQQINSLYRTPTFNKLDTGVYPKVIMGENNMHSFFHVGVAKFCRSDACGGNNSSALGSSISDTDSSTLSSVGSCSVMGSNAHNVPFIFSTEHVSNTDDCCSDAESSFGCEYEEKPCSLSSDEVLGLDGRRTELRAYHSAMRRLYALGPLSWEDEEKMTNLRDGLQISDDEHLMVIRNLISANRKLLLS